VGFLLCGTQFERQGWKCSTGSFLRIASGSKKHIGGFYSLTVRGPEFVRAEKPRQMRGKQGVKYQKGMTATPLLFFTKHEPPSV
jgi:hypothetical protein